MMKLHKVDLRQWQSMSFHNFVKGSFQGHQAKRIWKLLLQIPIPLIE